MNHLVCCLCHYVIVVSSCIMYNYDINEVVEDDFKMKILTVYFQRQPHGYRKVH